MSFPLPDLRPDPGKFCLRPKNLLLTLSAISAKFEYICGELFYYCFTKRMAVTLKAVVLKHNKRSDGTYNVKIRVTLNRRTSYISTEHYIGGRQISPDFSIKDKFILDEVNNDIRRLRLEISRLGAKVNKHTASSLAEYLSGKRSPGTGVGIDFIAFGRQKVEEMERRGRGATASVYTYALNKLEKYLNSSYLEIKDITVKFLRRYEEYLRETGVGSRGIESNLAAIRALFNFARDEYNEEDLEEMRIVHYPFAKYKIPRADIPAQRSLKMEDIVRIYNYRYSPASKYDPRREVSRPELARDVFLLSFFLVGMNSKDLYGVEARSLKGGRITYCRSKTKNRRRDKAEISIKVVPEAEELLRKYADPDGRYLFNFYKRYTDYRTFNANVNKGLKAVGEAVGIEDLEFYAARHSWATIARNDCAVSTDDISLSLNHTSMTRRVTEGYIKKDFGLIDKANDKVLGLFREAAKKAEKTPNTEG